MTRSRHSSRRILRRSPLARVALYAEALAAWRNLLLQRELRLGRSEMQAAELLQERHQRAIRHGDPPGVRAERDAFMDDYVSNAPP